MINITNKGLLDVTK